MYIQKLTKSIYPSNLLFVWDMIGTPVMQSKESKAHLKKAVFEELTCCICLELFSFPVIFECGHSVCEHCAKPLLHNLGRNKVIKCPLCSRITVLKNGAPLKQNITLNYLIIALTSSTNNQRHHHPHHHHKHHHKHQEQHRKHKKAETIQYEAVLSNLCFIADEVIKRWEQEYQTKVSFSLLFPLFYFLVFFSSSYWDHQIVIK